MRAGLQHQAENDKARRGDSARQSKHYLPHGAVPPTLAPVRRAPQHVVFSIRSGSCPLPKRAKTDT